MSWASFTAMGSAWALFCNDPAMLPGAEAVVHDAEQRLSRFLASSALTRLNVERRVDDALLASVVRAALYLRTATSGAFDPAVGSSIVRLGYDRGFESLKGRMTAGRADLARPEVRVRGDTVSLLGSGLLDLGGVAKGFTVDLTHDWLRSAGATVILVDGGGDIRGSGRPWPIGVGPGAAVHIDGGAVATSSTLKRRWLTADGGWAHHLVDPATGQSTETAIVTATVRAPRATTADAVATALVVDPDRVVQLLPVLNAQALVQEAGGAWWSTDDWEQAG